MWKHNICAFLTVLNGEWSSKCILDFFSFNSLPVILPPHRSIFPRSYLTAMRIWTHSSCWRRRTWMSWTSETPNTELCCSPQWSCCKNMMAGQVTNSVLYLPWDLRAHMHIIKRFHSSSWQNKNHLKVTGWITENPSYRKVSLVQLNINCYTNCRGQDFNMSVPATLQKQHRLLPGGHDKWREPPVVVAVHCRKQRPGARQPVWRLSGEAAPGQAWPRGKLAAGLGLLREQRAPG